MVTGLMEPIHVLLKEMRFIVHEALSIPNSPTLVRLLLLLSYSLSWSCYFIWQPATEGRAFPMVANVQSNIQERLDGKGTELNAAGREFSDSVASAPLAVGQEATGA